MISTNTLSVFILHRHQNGICNKNLQSIKEIMRTSDQALEKYKKVCNYFPNLAKLTKSAMAGVVQLTFTYASVGNKSLWESVAAFTLAGSLDSPSVILIDIYIAFSTEGDNIRLRITEVILITAAGDFVRSKKQRDWTPRNAVLLVPFLMKAEILDRGTDSGEILKVFA